MGLLINAATGELTPSGATAGNYVVTYTINGKGGCAEFNISTPVTINSAPTATISYPGSPYCGGTAMPQAVQFSGTQGGAYISSPDLSIDALTGAINPALSAPGTYTIRYVIAPSAPCPGYTATTSVVINESPVITFPESAKTICSGGTAIFHPSSTVANTAYAWSVVGSLPASVSGVSAGTASGANPSISLSFVNNGVQSQSVTIQVIPANPTPSPCTGKPYRVTMVVNPVPAELVTTATDLCMGTPAVALSVTPDQGNTVKWYDESFALLNSAPVISTALAGTFNYYVSQMNNFQCESPKAPIQAVVNVTPQIVGSSFTHPTSCGIPSGSITLDVLDLNGNGIPNFPLMLYYNRFQTAFAIAAATDANGQVVLPLTAGTYSNVYIESDRGCASQVVADVFVLKDPTPPAQPVAGYNPPICSESPLNLTALTATSSIAGPIDYVWAGPAFGPMPDTVRNTVITFPSASLADAGTYVVYALQNNCISASADFQVIVKQSPAKPKIFTRMPLCIGEDLVLQAYSSIPGNSALNFLWKGPGAGFPVNQSNAEISKVKLTDAGLYTITVSAPQTGCSASSDTLIQIGAYPIVKFAQDTMTLPTGYRLQLTPAITNATNPGVLPIQSYTWTPSSDLDCTTPLCATPVATIKNNVCYTVKATNFAGCSGSDTMCVNVFCQSSQVFVANAFSPRGNVAENTRLLVRASGIASVKSFRVFNRWGKIVFERNNFSPNSPEFGWDGMVNGKPADTGVYIYVVDVICENGVPYSYKGNATLL